MKKLAFVGGKVFTPVGFKEAVITEGDRIAFAGGTSEALAIATREKDVEKIELDGRVVVPGFCDSHAHFFSWAANASLLDLRSCRSIAEVRAALRKFIDSDANDGWIEGYGWDQEIFDHKIMPAREDLDDLSRDRPIMLTRICGHLAVFNTPALNTLDIDTHESDGIIREGQLEAVKKKMGALSKDEMSQLLKKFGPKIAEFGLTSINTDDLGMVGDDFQKLIEFYSGAENKMPFRLRQQFLLGNAELLRDFLSRGWRTGMGGRKFKVGPLKLLCDGSLGGRTAWLREGYSDAPNTRGIPTYMQEQLNELVLLAHSAGMQVAMHAIGDATLDLCLNAIEYAKSARKNLLRHVIVHCQIADDEQLDRMKRLGVGVLMQPCFVPSDREMAVSRLGNEKARASYRWKTMIDKGIVLAGSSDAPVESYSPLVGIHAAVTRQDAHGLPHGGWVESEKLSVAEALNLYTRAGAWLANEENLRGEIEEGKQADITILEDDIFTISPQRIKDVKVSMTVCGGEVTFGG